MISSLMSLDGLHFLFRYAHLFFAIVWIGHLYYLNFVQGPFMGETDAAAKSQVQQKLLPRVMWWFRYGALWTFVTGVSMLALKGHLEASATGQVNLNSPYWISILSGAGMATLMAFNVWFIIWPRQKMIIENALTTAKGGAANALVPAAAARAGVASRTNVLFSIPMMLFMISASHLGYLVNEASQIKLYWLAYAVIVLGIQANAFYGKTGPMTTVKGVISCGFALTVVFLVVQQVLI